MSFRGSEGYGMAFCLKFGVEFISGNKLSYFESSLLGNLVIYPLLCLGKKEILRCF